MIRTVFALSNLLGLNCFMRIHQSSDYPYMKRSITNIICLTTSASQLLFQTWMNAMEDYGSTFGTILIGSLVCVYLFGINTSQTWIYLRSYPNDRWQLKTFIMALWFLEFVHTLLIGWAAYESLVTHFGARDFSQLQLSPVLRISNLVSVGIITLVQLFFAYRLHKLSSLLAIPFIATTFHLIRLICYAAVTIRNILHHQGPQTTAWTWSLLFVGIMTIISDLLVVGGLSYSLWRRRLLWKAHSDHVSWWPRIIDHLIIISLEAGAFACIISTITLIIFNVSHHFPCMTASFVTCRLFSISCLTSIFCGRNLSLMEGNMPTLPVFLESAVDGLPQRPDQKASIQ